MNLPGLQIPSIWWEIDISTHKTDIENLFPFLMSQIVLKYPLPSEVVRNKRNPIEVRGMLNPNGINKGWLRLKSHIKNNRHSGNKSVKKSHVAESCREEPCNWENPNAETSS